MAKIIEVSHVTPFTDDSAEYSVVSEFSLPLTFCDTMWFKVPPVEALFFYSLAEPNESLLKSVVPKLKHSLRLTLRHFLPLAGTLTWPHDSPKPITLYRAPNDAVSLTIVESDSDFDALSGYEPREAASFRDLVPKLEVSESGASVISLQVTLFSNKGFSIGVTSHHAVLDGNSATMFIKSWAHFCREIKNDDDADFPPLSLPSELTPFFDRSVIKNPRGLDMFYLNWWLKLFSNHTYKNPRDNPKLFEINHDIHALHSSMVRATFVLTRTDIANLRGKINNKNNGEELQLSSFVVSYSHTLVCLLKAMEDDDGGAPTKVLVGFAGDLRQLMIPPLPENYFGNCVGMAKVFEDAREANVADVSAAAVMVSRMVRALKECTDVTEGAEERREKMMSLFPARFVGVVGSPRFRDYGIDFRWGRPQKVEIVSIDRSGAVSMMESRDVSGGIEIGVALKKHEMEIFTSVFAEGLN